MDIDLIKGDCFVLNEQIPDESIDLIVTDPPYGMSFQSGARKQKERKIANDDNIDWLPKWINQQYRVLKNNSHAYIFCSWHKVDRFKIEIEKAGFLIKNILIWEKPGVGMGDLTGGYGGGYEMIVFAHKGRRELTGKRSSDVIKVPRTGNTNHPTQKPVALYKWILDKYAKEGDKILDTHLGSMSIAIACADYDFELVGCELDKDYYDAGVKRLKNHVSQGRLF